MLFFFVFAHKRTHRQARLHAKLAAAAQPFLEALAMCYCYLLLLFIVIVFCFVIEQTSLNIISVNAIGDEHADLRRVDGTWPVRRPATSEEATTMFADMRCTRLHSLLCLTTTQHYHRYYYQY